MRDDFPAPVKKQIASRTGYRCSNPDCRRPTSGPQTKATASINLGVAAHMTAAAPGGPRYSKSHSSNRRKAITNAIWLCQNCAKLIDSDEREYPATVLRKWKRQAESIAKRELTTAIPDADRNLFSRCYQLGKLLEHTDALIKEARFGALQPLGLAFDLSDSDECMNVLWEVAEQLSDLSPRATADMYSVFQIEERGGPVDYAVYVCGTVLFKTWSDILFLANSVVFPDELREELKYWRSQCCSVLEDEIRAIAQVGQGMAPDREERLRYHLDSVYGTIAVLIGRSANSKKASSLFLGAGNRRGNRRGNRGQPGTQHVAGE